MSGQDIAALAVGGVLLLFVGWSLWTARTPKIERPSADNNWRRVSESSDYGLGPGIPSIGPEAAAVQFSTGGINGGVHF